MLPRVILHAAVSVDGRQDWIQPDLGLFYGLAAEFGEDVTLAGSNTLLAGAVTEGWNDEVPDPTRAIDRGPNPPETPGAGATLPLLVVPDSRGRIRCWNALRACGYWHDVLALTCATTPSAYLSYLEDMGVRYFSAGDNRVDLRASLEWLADNLGARVVRVDSGGVLNGALLRAGLVDEVSVLVDPTLVGGLTPRSLFRSEDLTSSEGVMRMDLTDVQRVGRGSVWLRYALQRPLLS